MLSILDSFTQREPMKGVMQALNQNLLTQDPLVLTTEVLKKVLEVVVWVVALGVLEICLVWALAVSSHFLVCASLFSSHQCRIHQELVN